MYMMRFDMRAPGLTPAQIADQYAAAIDMARWADEQGCIGIGLSEHHAAEDGYTPSPLMLASAMAAVTTKLRFFVAAALLPLYDPVRLAEDMVMLDYVSRGRVTFVFGIGYRPVEYQLYNLDYHQRGALADEKLSRLLEALERAAEATTMPRVTPPPLTLTRRHLMWGGATLAAARRAGRHGLGFFPQTNTPGLAEAYAEAARAQGFEPGPCRLPSAEMPNIVFVHPEPAQGWREVGPYLLADAQAYREWNQDTGHETVSLSKGSTIEALQAEHGARRVVDVREAVALIRRWGYLALHPLCGGCPPALGWTYLHRVVNEVLPALNAEPAVEPNA